MTYIDARQGGSVSEGSEIEHGVGGQSKWNVECGSEKGMGLRAVETEE